MDAVEFLKIKKRMCDYNESCCLCPAYYKNSGKDCECEDLESLYPEELVSIVEKWSKEYPAKTRQSEFLKMFPNARVEYGVIFMCPKEIDRTLNCKIDGTCGDCKKEYWLAVV